jgi:flagellin-like protein
MENARLSRRRRLGRRALSQKKEAVSPVVATLILILVAVAAAAALYLWLNGWQTGITNGIGSPGAHQTITLGGSTSVYPFDTYVVTQFQQNNSNIVVSNNQGGTGAGMLAVCSGAVQIGAASSLQTVSGLETNDGCPSGANNAPVITDVAYDAVDPIVAVSNPHGLVSIGADTLLTIYVKASTTAYTGTTAPQINGVLVSAYPAPLVIGGSGLTWNQVPACVNGAAACGGAGNPAEAIGTGVGAGAACPTGGATLICAAAGTSPCEWTVCAGGANNPIQTVERSDTSGTEQTFTAKLLAISGTNQLTTYSSEANNFGGCGSDGQLASCGITATFGENGNPAVIAQVASHTDSLGFASDGLARAGSSGVTCQGVATSACGIGFEAPGQASAFQPSLGSSGTIAKAVVDLHAGTPNAATEFAGWRPFQWVTLGAPTGEVQQLLSFCLQPANNIAFASESAEISIYSV